MKVTTESRAQINAQKLTDAHYRRIDLAGLAKPIY
jgi:hypothetical protein